MKTKLFFIFLVLLRIGNVSAQSVDSLSTLIEKTKKETINWDSVPGTDEQKILSIALQIPIKIEDEHKNQWKRDPWGVLYKKTIFTEREIWYSKNEKKFFVVPNQTIVGTYEVGKTAAVFMGLFLCIFCGMIALMQARVNEKKHLLYQPVLYVIIGLLLPTLTYLNPLGGGLTLIILVILFRRKTKLFILKIKRGNLTKKTC
ncbi:MAG: hypothetical protein DLD55_05510 [candidate division SR1 bacterium]|nr:MAG: hypothetical protein DLD55_05510 [candidate division SR1 bacterium]